MRNFIRKLRCDHEYHEIGTHRSPGDVPGYWVNYIIAYCPKCKKEKHISYSRYELNAKKRKIDKQFEEEN